MKKRLLVPMILAAAMLFSMTSCGSTETVKETVSTISEDIAEPADETEPAADADEDTSVVSGTVDTDKADTSSKKDQSAADSTSSAKTDTASSDSTASTGKTGSADQTTSSGKTNTSENSNKTTSGSASEGSSSSQTGTGETSDSSGNAEDDSWKADFEADLYENYGVVPDHYEYLGDNLYQVYVEIDGSIVPYVTVNSETGEYHG